MANFVYNSARALFAQGKIDWTGTTQPTGSIFESYKIMAALVNKSGGSGLLNYTPPADPNNDTAIYTATSSRNMESEFGYSAAAASCSLIRNASDAVITAELTGRVLVGATAACDASDIQFNNVPINPLTGTYGAIEAIVIYLETLTVGGQAGTGSQYWPVIAFFDVLTSGSMSVTPNGGDIIVQWSANGLFRL